MKKQLCLLTTLAVAGAMAFAQSGKLDGAWTSGLSRNAVSGFPALRTAEASVSAMPQRARAEVPQVAAIPGVASSQLPYYNYDLPDGYCNFYAFQFYGLNSTYYRGLAHSNTYNFDEREFIREWPHQGGGWGTGEDVIEAACFVGDVLYAYIGACEAFYQEPRGLWTIDLASGQKDDCLIEHSRWNCIPDKADNANCYVYEMSYDPTTDYIYALQRVATGQWGLYNSGTTNILRVDPHNPTAFEQVGTFTSESEYPLTMACDNGYMYIVTRCDAKNAEGVWENQFARLYKINLEEYAKFAKEDMELVGKVNSGYIQIEYTQTMEFDHTTHTLWWAGEDIDGKAFFTRLDTETADTDDVLFYPYGNYQYVAMAIPYQTAPDNAPSYVKDLTYQAAAQGVQRVDFTWTNPDTNYQLGKLADLTAIKVYRDGKLIQTLTPTGIGKEQKWSDDQVSSGVHVYNFVACNSEGDGLGRERRMFVGRDVPGAVVDLKVDVKGADATISWAASVRGAQGGWYDKESLVYDVVRMPDKVTIATGITATTVNDHADEFRGYSYRITPRNVDGPGVAKTSAVTPFGPVVPVPYELMFSDTEKANMITVVDGNGDGHKWTYGESASEDFRVYNYSMGCGNVAEDYLITPPMNFDPAKKYEIRFWYYTSVFSDTYERIQVCQGNAPTAEAQSTVLKTIFGYPENLGHIMEGTAYIEDPSKGGYLSIKAASDGNQGWISVKGLIVREYSATDLSVQNVDGPQYCYVNNDNKYTVTVRNEGYATVSTGTVSLLDKTSGQTLATAAVGDIEAGKSKDVTVIWKPAAKNPMVMLTAKVDLDGDTFAADNTWGDYLEIEVTEGTASDWKNVLEMDNHGWRPLYSAKGITHTETIYSLEEVGLGECDILGIAYTYDPADLDLTGLDNVPVELYVREYDNEIFDLATPDEAKFLPAASYTPVFSGSLDLTSIKPRTDATMMFAEPFHFSGTKHLVVKLVSDAVVTPDNVNWWIRSEEWRWPAWDDPNPGPLQFRSLYSFDDNTVKLNDQIPVIKISYKAINGVQGIVAVNASFAVEGRAVAFAAEQDEVAVYDLAGRQIYRAAATSRTAELAPGVYTVVAKRGADIATGKVAIR